MTPMNRRTALTVLASSSMLVNRFLPAAETTENDFTVLVMDPLAMELSCPCVKGYAQRNYNELGKYLAASMKRSVKVVFSESWVGATKSGKLPSGADLIIGKKSVVEFDAKAVKTAVSAVASLTGKDGKTTQYGMIVVRSKDPAKKVADLKGYEIFFGPEDCDEKHKAAIELLTSNGITLPRKLQTCSACSDGATKILEMSPDARAATVISSYAAPLLEGCGTVQKGDLRVVGETELIPFVTAFVTERVGEQDRTLIHDSLLEMVEMATLCAALETRRGFVEVADATELAKKK